MNQSEVLQRVVRHLFESVNLDNVSEKGAEIMREVGGCTAADLGMNSVDAVAFLKRVSDDFGVEISLEDAASWKTLSDLTDYLER